MCIYRVQRPLYFSLWRLLITEKYKKIQVLRTSTRHRYRDSLYFSFVPGTTTQALCRGRTRVKFQSCKYQLKSIKPPLYPHQYQSVSISKKHVMILWIDIFSLAFSRRHYPCRTKLHIDHAARDMGQRLHLKMIRHVLFKFKQENSLIRPVLADNGDDKQAANSHKAAMSYLQPEQQLSYGS